MGSKEKQKLNEAFEEALATFDFTKVEQIMKVLDWEWAFTKKGVPSIYEMITTCQELYNSVVEDLTAHQEETFAMASTGGFAIYVYTSDPRVEVMFILEEAVGFVEEEF